MHARELGLVLDFDETIANTFVPSPKGVGVKEAYEYAVCKVFSLEGLRRYQANGGLRNRSPREVVMGLMAGRSEADIRNATEELVAWKVKYLLAEAFGQPLDDGSPWPRLMPGFTSWWSSVSADPKVATIILSSGHRDLIAKTFTLHGLPQPDLMVTNDDMRRLSRPLEKPDRDLWKFMLSRAREAGCAFKKAVYVGDDPVRDGELVADLEGVRFLLFSSTQHPTFQSFADWGEFRSLCTW